MPTKKHPLLRLLNRMRRYRTTVILASICSVLNKIFDLGPPVLIGMAVDIVVQQEDSFIARFGIIDLGTQLWVLAGVTVAVWGLESAFEYGLALLWRNLAQTIQHDFRTEAYRHVQGLELAYFEDRSTGGLMAILNDDINQLERFLDIGANDIIQVLTTAIVVGGLFVGAAPTVTWLIILPMPLIFWGARRFQDSIGPRYEAVRERVSILNNQLSNSLSGIATIKSFATEDYEAEQVRRESQAYRESNRYAITLSAAFIPIIRMLILAGFTAMLISGGRLVLSGSLAVGTYSVLIFMTQRLLWPLTELGKTFDMYQRAMASTRRILDLLDTRPRIKEGRQQLPHSTVQGDIRFEAVTFEYRPTERISGVDNGKARPGGLPATIRDLSFHIPAGETAAIVGPTGAGKSTIVKLLLRFYDVQSGKICLDGHNIRDLRFADLRQAIGLVSQDVFLFHGTVRENIAYGTFDAGLEAIIAAAKIAEAHTFITQLPEGYDTIVGERGQKLSGGQRQRLSIARAVLKDPPILIFDEATSAVDNETEAAIQRSLERITVGRTTIIIAHRLSTVRNADRTYVLDQGGLMEQGTHNTLINGDGIYASLWRVQTGVQDAELSNL